MIKCNEQVFFFKKISLKLSELINVLLQVYSSKRYCILPPKM